MKPRGPELWTLDQLAEQVDAALRIDYQGSPNGQVSVIPSRRTIRYYTTLGILDRPAAMRGRTAFYDRRHLHQLVAIKRLQERGLSLVAVQERLAGLPDQKLRALAQPTTGTGRSSSEGPREFWSQAPTATAEDVSVAETRLTSLDEEAADLGDDVVGGTPELATRTLQEVTLGDGVSLTLPISHPLRPADLSSIRAAGEELMRILRERQLIQF